MSNQELFKRASHIFPGGVHSPVRSFKQIEQAPIFFKRGKGARLFDTDNKSYIDFCMSFGPLIHGHAFEPVVEELKKAAMDGISFGAAEVYSLELGEFITEQLPFIDQIRFVNSGTEATMTAIRIARGATGRDKIIKFAGCYHGHQDNLLIKAGSGLADMNESTSKGVPRGVIQDTIVLPLDDEAALEEAFHHYKDQIAAIIVEPLPANNGLLLQRIDFLKKMRKLTEDHDAILIFDEVISGFRVGMGGMVQETGIRPDLITYGKIIGAGLPVGAVAGKRHLMQELAPVGNVYQAGTLSANPLAMRCGLVNLQHLNDEVYIALEETTQKIVSLFNNFFQQSKEFKDLNAFSYQSLFWITPKTEKDITNLDLIPENLTSSFKKLFLLFIEKGIYLSPNSFEVGFVSTAHQKEIKNIEEILTKSL